MPPVIDTLAQSGLWLVVSFALFGLLQELRPVAVGQRWLRKDAGTDLVYWFAGPFLYGAISVGVFMAGLWVIHGGDQARVQAFLEGAPRGLGGLPLWAQVIVALIAADFMMYWLHRLFHTAALWRFHAVHHSPQEMDFLSAVRFHPVNVVFYSIPATSALLWAGLDPLALAILGPFNILYSGMVHANLDWTFGPLRRVFASPVFHRWHHTGPDEGGNSNFAPTFPIWDLLFGTFYMPDGARPLALGVVERDVPDDVLGQLLHPLRRRGATQGPHAETA